MLHAVLWQPVIPQNVGNIARTCVGMNAHLHVVGPTIIDFDDKAVKRAGLDYWDDLKFTLHAMPEDFLAWLEQTNKTPWLITKHGAQRFDEPDFSDNEVFLFGSEREGLPPEIHTQFSTRALSIPIPGAVRSYNLGNSVAIVLASAMSKANLWPKEWAPKAGYDVKNTF